MKENSFYNLHNTYDGNNASMWAHRCEPTSSEWEYVSVEAWKMSENPFWVSSIQN